MLSASRPIVKRATPEHASCARSINILSKSSARAGRAHPERALKGWPTIFPHGKVECHFEIDTLWWWRKNGPIGSLMSQPHIRCAGRGDETSHPRTARRGNEERGAHEAQ